ncbi:MAG: RHS repeat protein, partial [Candidatus Competibacter sp.]|nr:RHS repeat protein [Candidatus Competibacter sp.]
VTDPLGRTVSYAYDAAGRVTTQTLPDGRQILYGYDAGGNLTSLTPPGRSAHVFAYTPVDLTQQYTPPAVDAGNPSTVYAYNADQQLTQVSRPDGQTVSFASDGAGRLNTLTTPSGAYDYSYNAAGKLAGIAAPDGGLAYSYSGALLTQTAWTGAVAGAVGFAYDNDFRLTSVSVNGANPVAYQYDPDSLLTRAGDLTLSRDAQNGLLTGTVLGSVSDSLGYNGFGEVATYSAAHNGAALFATQYTRDALGRITEKRETVQGVADTYAYGYDPAGRLVQVSKNGAVASGYAYDANGNRLSKTAGGSTVNGTYDAQDRLTQYGGTTYAYTANGELAGKTAGGQTTAYQYDVLGNLRRVTLPGGTEIEYLIDGANRRIGKKIGGVLAQGFLYQDGLKPVAELDGGGQIVSRFVYATGINVPDYMVKSGATYRIVTDHLGSPRLVVDTGTGNVLQRMDYDEFGNVLSDTNPGFQPFGFAGGLYDRDTRLVRFGARDYDAETGRWTVKDPILFSGSGANLYSYALNDSVNNFDVNGLQTESNAWEIIGNIYKDMMDKLVDVFFPDYAGPIYEAGTSAAEMAPGAAATSLRTIRLQAGRLASQVAQRNAFEGNSKVSDLSKILDDISRASIEGNGCGLTRAKQIFNTLEYEAGQKNVGALVKYLPELKEIRDQIVPKPYRQKLDNF